MLLQELAIAHKARPICENIVLWAQDRGWVTLRIHGPFLLDFRLPNCISNNYRLNSLFQVVNGLGYNSQHLVVIPNAKIISDWGLIALEEGAFIAEGHWRVMNIINSPIYNSEWPIFNRRRLNGDYYCLMGHWGSNYHHWLWDEVPRVFSALPYLPSGIRFIVAESMKEYQKQSLEPLGINNTKCVMQDPYTETTVERLWFATPLGHSEQAATAPDIVDKLRDTYRKAYTAEDDKSSKKIYISRKNSKNRKLINEDEIINILRNYGFQAIIAEKMQFYEQVKLFAEAKIIIGPHGAGLTNMIFSKTGTSIIEIHPTKVTRFHYWMMANILGHKYSCVVGDKEETFGNIMNNIEEEYFFVKIEKIIKCLEIAELL